MRALAAGHEKAARRRPVAGQEELGAVLLAMLFKQRLGFGPLAVQREDIGYPPRQFVGREVECLQGLLERIRVSRLDDRSRFGNQRNEATRKAVLCDPPALSLTFRGMAVADDALTNDGS